MSEIEFPDLENEIEIDFTKAPDRVQEYLDAPEDGHEDPNDLIDVPSWLDTDADLDELYSHESLVKAVKLIKNNKIRDAGRAGLFDVHGSDLYVCNIVELEGSTGLPAVTCTCPNGSHRAGRPTCYHSAAAIMVYTGMNLVELEKRFSE